MLSCLSICSFSPAFGGLAAVKFPFSHRVLTHKQRSCAHLSTFCLFCFSGSVWSPWNTAEPKKTKKKPLIHLSHAHTCWSYSWSFAGCLHEPASPPAAVKLLAVYTGSELCRHNKPRSSTHSAHTLTHTPYGAGSLHFAASRLSLFEQRLQGLRYVTAQTIFTQEEAHIKNR